MPIESDFRFTFAVNDESFDVVEFTSRRVLPKHSVRRMARVSANAAVDVRNVLDLAALLTIRNGQPTARQVAVAVQQILSSSTAARAPSPMTRVRSRVSPAASQCSRRRFARDARWRAAASAITTS